MQMARARWTQPKQGRPNHRPARWMPPQQAIARPGRWGGVPTQPQHTMTVHSGAARPPQPRKAGRTQCARRPGGARAGPVVGRRCNARGPPSARRPSAPRPWLRAHCPLHTPAPVMGEARGAGARNDLGWHLPKWTTSGRGEVPPAALKRVDGVVRPSGDSRGGRDKLQQATR